MPKRARPKPAAISAPSRMAGAPEHEPSGEAQGSFVDGRRTALAVAHAGLERKARDVVVLDVRKFATYADYFVVMSADSERQLAAVAEQIEDDLAEVGRYAYGVEGVGGGRWVLVDFGDVVAHVFHAEARAFYDLEGLWSDAPWETVAD